jgi:hypothetical protein
MNPVLPDDAREFGETARKAFDALGGVDAARHAEEDRGFRSDVAKTLDALGIDDIDPRADVDTFAAAAALCEAAGRVVLPYPVLWEHKIMNNKNFLQVVKHGVKKSKFIYFVQMQIYMAYMGDMTHALFHAWNADTSEMYFELVPFDAAVAQAASDRGVSAIATAIPEEAPRITTDPSDFRCRFCNWHDRCWRVATPASAESAPPAWLANATKPITEQRATT